jgi:BirA family biotin operon repressor/biotin-[acetyl-CoA-carboxylase] ligase
MYRREVVDSTLLEAKRIRTTVKQPFTVVSLSQSGGIGRLGRSWTSPKGGLWFTLCRPATRPIQQYGCLPLVAGVAVAQILEQVLQGTDAAITIKWPNDILLNDAKVGGMLCQSTSDAAGLALLVGIGINVAFPWESFPADLRSPATTIAAETGVLLSAQDLESPLTAALMASIDLYERDGFAPFLMEVRCRLAWLGQEVSVEVDSEEVVLGELAGIDEDGRLEIYTAGRRRLIASADVTRVRRT